MTEQKPVAWSYSWAFGEVLTRHDPTARAAKDHLRDVRPLYERPTPLTDQKPVAWICEYRSGWGQNNWLTDVSEHRPKECDTIRNVRSLYEHPAPSQPATDPVVEAARRKALRHLLDKLEHHSQCSDWAPIVMAFGVLRDLVGQPRKDPERRIPGYDEEPDLKVSATMRETRVNTADLAPTLPVTSVQALAEVILACSTDTRVRRRAWHDASIPQRSRAVSGAEALRRVLYGKDAE